MRIRFVTNSLPGWGGALALLAALALPGRALAQQAPAADTTRAPTATTPVVAPTAEGASGLPSSEFETYTVKAKGTRYTATLTGIYSAGTVERIYFTTSHTANFKLTRHWLLPASASTLATASRMGCCASASCWACSRPPTSAAG